MENYLQQNEGSILFVGMLAALIVAAILEIIIPRRVEAPGTPQRWASNISLTVINQFCVNALVVVATIVIAWWSENNNRGLLVNLDLGFWSMFVLAVLIFEFVAYWFHRALHAFPWLWRLHAVHHCDTELDFSTTYRNHPLELLINAPLTFPVIIFLGFPVAVVTLYQLLKTTISVIAHSNIRLPAEVDSILRILIITPDYHRLHHSSDRKFTDSNYCAAFPLYDYLFGTARSRPYGDHETMEIGLDDFRSPYDNRLDRLLLMPFVWKSGHGKKRSRQPKTA